jgi:hypothetical protein
VLRFILSYHSSSLFPFLIDFGNSEIFSDTFYHSFLEFPQQTKMGTFQAPFLIHFLNFLNRQLETFQAPFFIETLLLLFCHPCVTLYFPFPVLGPPILLYLTHSCILLLPCCWKPPITLLVLRQIARLYFYLLFKHPAYIFLYQSYLYFNVGFNLINTLNLIGCVIMVSWNTPTTLCPHLWCVHLPYYLPLLNYLSYSG